MDKIGGAAGAPMLILLVRARSWICSFPVSEVAETMRPLATESVPDTPPFVLGLSVIRGIPIPVVDLGGLLGLAEDPAATRFVIVRVGERHVAIAVEEVVGVQEIDRGVLEELPPLMAEASRECVQAIGRLDDELNFVLGAARIVPPEVWAALDSTQEAP